MQRLKAWLTTVGNRATSAILTRVLYKNRKITSQNALLRFYSIYKTVRHFAYLISSVTAPA